MKVAIRCTVDRPGSLGGAALYSVFLAEALSKIVDRVDVYTPAPEVFPRCNAIRVDPLFNPSRMRRTFRWAKQLLIVPPQVSGVNGVILGNQSEPLVEAAAATRVMVVHDVIPLLFPRLYPYSYPYYKYCLPRVLRKVDRVIVRTESTKRDVVGHYGLPASWVEVIPGGFQELVLAQWEEDCGARSPRERFGDYLLYIGQHWPHKNLARLIEAFSLVRGRFDIALVLVGEISPRYSQSCWEVAQRCGVGDAVHILEALSRRELGQVLRSARLVVHPSLHEGFGMPPLEAMAAGVPVAVSRCSSLPEVCGNAAVYFDPLNVLDIARAIEKLLTSEEIRAQCISSGYERIKTFDWDASARQYVDLITRLQERTDRTVLHQSKSA